MEIQIPLVLFTSFLAWSVGIFGTQALLAMKKKGGEIQVPSLIAAVIVLAIGGIAVVFHLTHPFNLFNGFGHLTSGITQELIAIVILVVVMVIYFLMLRRSEDNSVPAWLAVLAIVAGLILIVAMGHSYMMPSRPAWNSILQLLSLLGAACVLGPATVAIIAGAKKVDIPELGLFNVVGSLVNAVLVAAFLGIMSMAGGSFESFSYYFDPTHPNNPLKSGADMALTSGNAMGMTVLVVLGALVAVIGAFVGKKQENKWLTWGCIILAAGLICTIALRVLMYMMGETMFMLY